MEHIPLRRHLAGDSVVPEQSAIIVAVRGFRETPAFARVVLEDDGRRIMGQVSSGLRDSRVLLLIGVCFRVVRELEFQLRV